MTAVAWSANPGPQFRTIVMSAQKAASCSTDAMGPRPEFRQMLRAPHEVHPHAPLSAVGSTRTGLTW